MADHLGYDKHDPAGRNRENSRNGSRSKTVLTDIGPVQIEVPRDREGTFDPVIVRKRQRRLDGIDQIVLSLTARGLTTGEISAHFAEVYGAEISKDTISRITDAVVTEMIEWQNRPLDQVYPVLFIDAIVVKVRDGQVTNRPVYAVIGVTTWQLATVQTCIIHLIRNTFRFASRADWEKMARDLRPVYCAVNAEMAAARFAEFNEVWGSKYPAITTLWTNAWNEFIPFLDYDVEIRRVICSTNAIDSLNARYRRAVRARGHFPTEQAALKCLYLVIRSLDPTGKGRARWVTRWKPALNAFAITFEGRLFPSNIS
jgi:transposase-like protein